MTPNCPKITTRRSPSAGRQRMRSGRRQLEVEKGLASFTPNRSLSGDDSDSAARKRFGPGERHGTPGPKSAGICPVTGRQMHRERRRPSESEASDDSVIEQEVNYSMERDEVLKNENKNTGTAAKKSRHHENDTFMDYGYLSQRLKKTMYFANKMPSTTRPSFPLTMLAVNAFTSGRLGTSQLNTLEFLDLEMASEIGRNACVSPTALIMALVYLDRLSNQNSNYLTSVKPSELFVVALLVASKFIQDEGEDHCIYNDEWAESAKMEIKKINRLEIKFLNALDWKVNVTSNEFENVLQRIEVNLAIEQGNLRGWFTYTELEKLSETIVTWKLIWPTVYQYAVQVITAATLTYTAILTTLLSSTILAPQIYTISKAVLATTNSNQGSIFSGLEFANLNAYTERCLDFNNTFHFSADDPLSYVSFELNLEQVELETDEESGNKSDLKLPSYFQYANKPQKYFQPHSYRPYVLNVDGQRRQYDIRG